MIASSQEKVSGPYFFKRKNDDDDLSERFLIKHDVCLVTTIHFGYDAINTDMDLYGKSIEIYGNVVETHRLVPEMSYIGN